MGGPPSSSGGYWKRGRPVQYRSGGCWCAGDRAVRTHRCRGPIRHERWGVARRGGLQQARILHAADTTSAAIRLVKKLKFNRRIEIKEDLSCWILTDEHCSGCLAPSMTPKGEPIIYSARALIIATGGLGRFTNIPPTPTWLPVTVCPHVFGPGASSPIWNFSSFIPPCYSATNPSAF